MIYTFDQALKRSGTTIDQVKSLGIGTPTEIPKQGSISRAFQGGISQAKEGYTQAREATNPLQLLEGGTKLATGAISTAFSPLAPITEPIGKGVEKIADIISNNPDFQKFAGSRAGEIASRIAEDVANLSVIAGTVAGGIKVPKIPETLASVTKPVVEAVSNKVQSSLSKLRPTEYTGAIKNINDAYKSAFVSDSVAINKKLTQLGNIIGSSPDKLVNNLAKEGIIPQVEGKLAKFDNSLTELTNKQNTIAQTAQNSLKQFKEPTSLNELKSNLIKDVKRTADPAELTKSLAEVDRTIESYRLKYGDTLMPENLGEIRISANDATKAFDRPIFEQDVSNSIGNVVRRRLDDIVPNEAYKQVNAEWGRLADLKRTIQIFDNTPINVGVLGSQLGRFGGAVAVGATFLPLSGPGALVIAGIAATYGGDFVASFLRNRKFSPRVQNIIIESLKKQPDVLQKLINEASEENARFLQQTLLPKPSYIPLRGKTPSKSGIEIIPATKNPVSVNPKTGKFQTTYSTTPKK